ncbi:MAG: hypothetical protein ACE5JS_15230 [Nitrospinota bacterium]
MRKYLLPVLPFLFFGLGWLNPGPGIAEEALAGRGEPDSDKILALRQESDSYNRQDIEFMVRVVFADAMNSERWVNNWIRRNHIPSVTHLVVHRRRKPTENFAFTVLTLPEWANHQVVVVHGFQGNPRVRRWMSVDALKTYFRKFTTSKGEIRRFEAGFLGLKGLQMGMDLKNLLDDLHARGLMRTEKEPPLSEEQERQNSYLQLALSQKLS